jgi:hypothetical protein
MSRPTQHALSLRSLNDRKRIVEIMRKARKPHHRVDVLRTREVAADRVIGCSTA